MDARRNGMSDQEIEASVETAESREATAAWVVIAGVALESYFRSIDFFTSPTWRSFDDLFGGLLIVIGIAAEIYFGGKASRGRKLQVARLNVIAEQEKLARIKIEERLAFRSLTDLQRSDLADTLRLYAGQEYAAHCVAVTPEVESMCRLLFETLKRAGWRSIQPSCSILMDVVLVGIRVSTSPRADERAKNAADLLMVSLQTFSIAAYRSVEDWITSDSAVIIGVGTKPQ